MCFAVWDVLEGQHWSPWLSLWAFLHFASQADNLSICAPSGHCMSWKQGCLDGLKTPASIYFQLLNRKGPVQLFFWFIVSKILDNIHICSLVYYDYSPFECFVLSGCWSKVSLTNWALWKKEGFVSSKSWGPRTQPQPQVPGGLMLTVPHVRNTYERGHTVREEARNSLGSQTHFHGT